MAFHASVFFEQHGKTSTCFHPAYGLKQMMFGSLAPSVYTLRLTSGDHSDCLYVQLSPASNVVIRWDGLRNQYAWGLDRMEAGYNPMPH